MYLKMRQSVNLLIQYIIRFLPILYPLLWITFCF